MLALIFPLLPTFPLDPHVGTTIPYDSDSDGDILDDGRFAGK